MIAGIYNCASVRCGAAQHILIAHFNFWTTMRRHLLIRTLPLQRRSLFPRHSSSTTLWCGQVVFASQTVGAQDEDVADPNTSSLDLIGGSVDIIHGKIAACHPGETWQEAHARNPKRAQNLGSDMVLSPGMIDAHTHISTLGRDWEGYETATKAAAAGGITTLMGMPLNSIPATTTLEAVELERKAAEEAVAMYVDVGLWGGVVADNWQDLEPLLDSPLIFGLKAFLAPLPPAAGYQAVTPAQLLEAARVCGPTGKPILVHSELMTAEESEQAVLEAFFDKSPRSYAAHLESRPAQWEQDAVRVVIQAAEHCRMHIVHLSDARGCLPIIRESKESLSSAYDLSVETCPHYLLLDDSMIQDGETLVKCFPPIRDAENRELLWDGLSEGLIDMVASDHSPCKPDMRNMETGDIQTAWGGLSGLQYQLQATWTDAVKRKCTPLDMARWWSERPAALAGLYGRKGRILRGHDADLCWWDPHCIRAPNDYSREYHRWTGATHFADNARMHGRVLGTWVKGTLVYDGIADEHGTPAGELLTS